MPMVAFLLSVWLSDESWVCFDIIAARSRRLITGQCLWLEIEPVWLCNGG